MNTTKHHWLSVIFGSDNGLVPSGNNPFSEQDLSRVGNSVLAWSVSLWLLWRVCFDFCDGIGEVKKNVRSIRLWCGVQSSWICIRCDGFVVRLKLMWRYHPDHVTVSYWHFQEDIVIRWRGFDGVYWYIWYIIWRFDKWCWSKNRWRRQLSWSWRC